MTLDDIPYQLALLRYMFKHTYKTYIELKRGHIYYLPHRIHIETAKKTRRENLVIMAGLIPKSREEVPESLVISAAPAYTPRPLRRYEVERRLRLVDQGLARLESKTQYLIHSRRRRFTYVVAEKFQTGAYEYVSKLNREKNHHVARCIPLKYTNILDVVRLDLARYITSRVSGILRGNYHKSDGKVFSHLKRQLDFFLLFLASTVDPKSLNPDSDTPIRATVSELKELVTQTEAPVSSYQTIYTRLVEALNTSLPLFRSSQYSINNILAWQEPKVNARTFW